MYYNISIGEPTDRSSLELDDAAALVYGYPRSTLRIQVLDQNGGPVSGAGVELLGTASPVNGDSIKEGGKVYGDIASSLMGDEVSSPTYVETSPFRDTGASGYTNYINPIHESFTAWATKGNLSGIKDIDAPKGVSTVIVRLDTTETGPPDTAIDDGPAGTISYNDVTFHYSGTDDVTPTRRIVYSYRLDGLDSSWSPYSASTSKSYDGLPNGSYLFQVRAKDWAGKVDITPASISFSVNRKYEIWHVDADVGISGTGKNWHEAFKTLQEAINASKDGDEIWVKAGTYALFASLLIDKAIAIYGGFEGSESGRDERDWEANKTTIDGQGNVNCFVVTAGATIDGVKIINGYAEFGVTNYRNGAGVMIKDASPTVRNCVLTGNTSRGSGGGMSIENASPEVNSCTFSGNSASRGGAIAIEKTSAPYITDCKITDNTARLDGGGIYILENSSPVILNSDILRNKADSGGGIDCNTSSASIIDCKIIDNQATDNLGLAGGISISSSSATLEKCYITGNTAEGSGGAISVSLSLAELTNCIVSGNEASSGGGLYTYLSTCNITNCTIYGNEAKGQNAGGLMNMQAYSGINITNSIFRENTPDEIYPVENNATVTYLVNYCDIPIEFAGEGNINVDPLFVDPDAADFHLAPGSPCIDSGISIGALKTDIEGNSRPQGKGYDMGASEYFSDSDGDGLPDSLENETCPSPTDADSDDDGIPDGVEDKNRNGVVDINETDPCDIDTDRDGVQDGTETGLTDDDVGPETGGAFQPDLDPTTTTDPLDSDTDDDGFKDGEEDVNHNGRVDPGERDPGEFNSKATPWLWPLLLSD